MVKDTVFGFEGFKETVYNEVTFLDSSMVEHAAVNRGVVGSSPTRGAFWLRGQAVKTSPFHGGNTSSILVGVIKKIYIAFRSIFLYNYIVAAR